MASEINVWCAQRQPAPSSALLPAFADRDTDANRERDLEAIVEAASNSSAVACFEAASYRSVIQVSSGAAASRARISHIRPRGASRATDWPLNTRPPKTPWA